MHSVAAMPDAAASQSAERHEFVRAMTLTDATMLVAGSMIGSGIFIVSADIGRTVGSPFWLLVVWLLTAVITVLGALAYGELAAMFPRAGGQYVFLRESLGAAARVSVRVDVVSRHSDRHDRGGRRGGSASSWAC